MNPNRKFEKAAMMILWIVVVFVFVQGCNESGKSKPDAKNIVLTDTTKVDLPVEEPSPVDDAALELTELARWMSAMHPMDAKAGGTLDSMRNSDAWKAHETFFHEVWDKVDTSQLAKLKPWAAKHLPKEQLAKEVFYPFSGPDFLYANAFFPNADLYVMCGLEPVGVVPNLEKLSERQVNTGLKGIQTSLYAIMKWSFFRTKDMKNDFVRTEFEGIVPMLMVFMARTGHILLNVDQVMIDTTGKVRVVGEDWNEEDKTGFPGAHITFVAEGQKKPRHVYYFSGDISNNNWPNVDQFGTFVRAMDRPVTYLKSASYLMHKPYFSEVRNLIKEKSKAILQDDSGINLKYIDESEWDLHFFGKYVGPIGLFSNWYQKPMEKYYKTENVIPLDFGIGYQYKAGRSNLMIFRAKEKADSEMKEEIGKMAEEELELMQEKKFKK